MKFQDMVKTDNSSKENLMDVQLLKQKNNCQYGTYYYVIEYNNGTETKSKAGYLYIQR